MSPNPADVDQLLQTILVPSFPPNRSQWRKLEIAMKFINKSKTSSSQTKSVIAPTYREQDFNQTCGRNSDYLTKTETRKINSKINFKMTPDEKIGDYRYDSKGSLKRENICLKRQGSWSKIKHSVKRIL